MGPSKEKVEHLHDKIEIGPERFRQRFRIGSEPAGSARLGRMFPRSGGLIPLE
jgi:hypothetical protein